MIFSILASKAISTSTRLKSNSHQQYKFAVSEFCTYNFLLVLFGERSWTRASKDFAEVTGVSQPLCVALGPSLDWNFGYQSIDGQQKWRRRRKKGSDLKPGCFYKSRLSPSFIFLATIIFFHAFYNVGLLL